MDREKLQSFVRAAATSLSLIRSSLLIVAQTGDASDLAISRRDLARLKTAASESGALAVAALIADCDFALEQLAASARVSPSAAYAALDIIARIEAAVWEIPVHSDDFISDVAGFVDASFDGFVPNAELDPYIEPEFEIDEETLDIFRTEAEELLANIMADLDALSASPHDKEALWGVRRNAHTFKGAAGIVGMKDASNVAHRMEDLLDKIVEMQREAAPQVIDFLNASAGRLAAIVAAKDAGEESDLELQYNNVTAWLSSPPETKGGSADQLSAVPAPVETTRSTTTPVVRVSLDRLDELIKISRSLLSNGKAVAGLFSDFVDEPGQNSNYLARLSSLFDAQRQMIDEIQAKLLKIRMIKFGTLETRLGRAVNVTCLDENKKAGIEIENGDVEIDTQDIDALIEPLLHLLKNAVVHGIEPPDTRRMIGKPERGIISIGIEADDEAIVLSVKDDGSGISVHKLKEKALATGLIDAQTAAAMNEREAMNLIFDRGLTTADKIDLNAGRGVGMSIVKESVENRGGTVLVESEPQRGTTFTIFMPLASAIPGPILVVPEPALHVPAAETVAARLPLVMIVDDSASIRHQTSKIVREAGFHSVTAISVAEGLEILRSVGESPAMILSDIEMPQTDGWKFLEYLKTSNDFNHIPVVMVSSLDADEHQQRAFDLGACGYIVKPFSSGSFEKLLEQLGLAVAV